MNCCQYESRPGFRSAISSWSHVFQIAESFPTKWLSTVASCGVFDIRGPRINKVVSRDARYRIGAYPGADSEACHATTCHLSDRRT